jgi:hypothetical protein
VGLSIIAAGAMMAVRAWRGSFMKRLSEPPGTGQWLKRLGSAGLFARAVVFWIIGGFLIIAAWHARSGEARGLDGVLAALQDQPYGWILLSLVALGLAAFGAFDLAQAAYRRIEPPDITHPETILQRRQGGPRGVHLR